MEKMVKTKIIATIGPGTSTDEKISDLIKAGARVFRINSSHESMQIHKERIESVRKMAKELKTPVAVMLDLQGPKIRVGNLKEPIELQDNQEIKIKPGMDIDEENTIPVDYSGIIKDVKKGDKLLLDDGKIQLIATDKTPEYVLARVVHGGILKPRKGLNIPGTTASISAVTARDIEFIKFGVENDVDYIALSFVRERDDIIKARHYVHKFNGNIPIIAKIEKPQALDNLVSIISASDGVMVARGDLGIEISPEKVPIVQKQIIHEANLQKKAVITATQMLETMISEPMPTRAEASDIANAIIDGTDAVMLSGETAVGKYPAEAVNMMRLIADNVESSNLYLPNQNLTQSKEIYDVDAQAIASAVIRLVSEVEVGAIVAFTRSGFTAKLLAKAKPSRPIIAFVNNEKVYRQLSLYWGVFPYMLGFDVNCSEEELLEKVEKILIKNTFLNAGDKVILTGGTLYSTTGKRNFLRLHQIGSAGMLM